MRNILFALFTYSMLTASFAQGWRQGEMELKVTVNSQQDAEKLAALNLNGDIYSTHALLYVIPDEMQKVAATGLDYTVQIADLNTHFRHFWEKDDAYHSYQEIIDLADSLAENFPSICKKVVYGTSLGGRQLAALKISDNVVTDENEAELFFDGGIHGDEIGGPENLIRFARDLCLRYGSNTQITNLINGRETWLYLMVNPDGRVNMTRYNNNGEDLNRDCGYMWDQESVGSWSQHETRVLREALMANQYVVYTSYHSGTEFISHPWSYRASQSPDHAHVNQLASVYADVSGYSNIPYGPGYTGMYPINGSTKDASYGIQGSVSWSLEISMDKQPPASQIMLYYNYNKPAMLALMEYSGYGLAGTVTDETTGEPVAATVFVNNYYPCYTDLEVGDYHKYVLPGTYNITVKANGYQTKVVTGIVVTANNATVTNVQLTPDNNQGIYKIIACQIPGNNFNDEGATWACIGQPDNVNYSLGKSGWIIVDMQNIIFDGAGPDLMVFEGDASAEGYTLYAGASMDGPWYTMGTGSGSTEFSFENCTLSEARYFKILDDGDGSASVADAGFDLDAIQALSAVTGPYLLLESVEVDDSNGNNNGILEPGETADYIITLKNVGSENALAIVGTLSCNDPYVTVVTTQPQTFGNININASATATYTVSAEAGAPAGHVATLQLDYQGTNVALTTKLIDVTFPDYCSASTSTEDEYISNVSFGTINNSSGWQGGVGNYTNLSTILEPGVAVPITITNGNAWASDIVYVWVDWNRDMEFGIQTNETFQLTNVGGQGQTFTGNITAPAGQNPGSYRMRIRMTYSTAPTPCGSATYGEVEDYTVVVAGININFSAAPTQVLTGEPVSFSDLSAGQITSWQWDFQNDGTIDSYAQNPVFTYETAGVYSVKLMVEDANGNSAELIKQNYITVFAPEYHFLPIWSSPYNPMTFYILKAAIDEIDLGSGAEVGIFDIDPNTGEEICVGVGVIVEPLTGGNYLEIIASMDDGSVVGQANGFTPGHEIIYKLWSETTGETSTVQPNYPYPGYDEVFASQGSAFAELNGFTTITQEISLQTGWNLMSFRVEPENWNMLTIVQPLIDQGVLYKVLDEAGGSIFHLPFPPPYGQWSNTIGNMANTEGYYVKVTGDGSLSLEGYPVETPMDIPLNTGWNIISYPCEFFQNALAAVQPLIDAGVLFKVIDEEGGTIFHLPFPPPNGQWSNTIGNFESGEGYYVKVTGNATLNISCPVDGSDALPELPVKQQTQFFQPVWDNNPYMPMHIVLYPNEDLAIGDEIGVFDGEVCVGASVYDGNVENPVIIVASMDDPETEKVEGYTTGNDIQVKYLNQESSKISIATFIIIDGDEVFMSLGTVIGWIELPLTHVENISVNDIAVEIFPNPAQDKINISFEEVINTRIQVTMLTLTGEMMYKNEFHPNNKSINIEFPGVLSGCYYLKLEFPDSKINVVFKKVLFINH